MATQKIIQQVCANPIGNDHRAGFNAEWVELRIWRSDDLCGHKIVHLANPRTPRERWDVFYVLPVGSRFSIGTLLRIHSGQGTPHADSNGVFHRYTGKPFRINNTGDVLRVQSPTGEVFDEYVVRPGECPTTTKPNIVKPVRAYGNS